MPSVALCSESTGVEFESFVLVLKNMVKSQSRLQMNVTVKICALDFWIELVRRGQTPRGLWFACLNILWHLQRKGILCFWSVQSRNVSLEWWTVILCRTDARWEVQVSGEYSCRQYIMHAPPSCFGNLTISVSCCNFVMCIFAVYKLLTESMALNRIEFCSSMWCHVWRLLFTDTVPTKCQSLIVCSRNITYLSFTIRIYTDFCSIVDPRKYDVLSECTMSFLW